MLKRLGNAPNQLKRLFVSLVPVLTLTAVFIFVTRPVFAASAGAGGPVVCRGRRCGRGDQTVW